MDSIGAGMLSVGFISKHDWHIRQVTGSPLQISRYSPHSHLTV